jgi:WD40 repeat protein/biotin carboxyl carrier protein
MLRRILGPAFAGVLLVSVSACDADRSSSSSNGGGTASVTATPAAPVEIGDPLFQPAQAPSRPAAAAAPPIQPIIVRQCQVMLPETQDVPSKNSGRLLHFCTEIQPGENVPPDQIIEHPSTHVKYKRLMEGSFVKAGQLIGFLDDKLAAANMHIEEATIKANQAKLEAANQLRESFDAEFKMYYNLWKTAAGSESDARRARAQFDKSVADVADAKGQLLKSTEDFNKAKVILEEHEIRSTIPGKINRFYRRPGESVKELEAVAQVQFLDKLRVEGMLEVQDLPAVNYMQNSGKPIKVVVESAPQVNALQQLPGHLQPVRAVAVTKDPKRPLIVSAGEDRTARVWDRNEGPKAVLLHPAAVRAVACTPPTGEGNLCLTGADDGIARIWDLDNPEPAKTVRELKGRHQARIVAVAFAPDGKTCVTADEKEVCLWDTASGEMKYRFPPQHRGQITYVQYTPQAKLLSVARDHSLCLWKLGDKGAAPDKTIDYRSGDVGVLGVSPDGQSVLFDQERELHVLSIDDATFQRTEGVLRAPSDASQFATFALFSPDGRMVLAAGTADNPLQLWKAPTPGARAYLIRRWAVSAASAPTCAAFAPDGSFAVTGTQDHKVMVWRIPPEAETKQDLTGTLTFTSAEMHPAERKVRIWADLTNTGGSRLLAGESVTLVIPITPPESK